MPAYAVFIRDRMNDPTEFATYQQKGRSARGDHPLTPLAFYGACETWEGEPADGVVILQFPTMEAARAWYQSPAYQDALQHRKRAADYRVVLVEGL
jgi:uncharacterized protein (DUF1330 family)